MARKTNKGNITTTYRGSEEKLPDKVGIIKKQTDIRRNTKFSLLKFKIEETKYQITNRAAKTSNKVVNTTGK